jgi:hypothetical protein
MRRRTKAALVAGLMAVALIAGASAAFADEPPLWLVLACAAAEATYGRGSEPYNFLGCSALEHPNPQA